MANHPKPSGGYLGLMALPATAPAPPSQAPPPAATPAWSRPDDATRQAQLDAMKWRATGLLGFALAVFIAARAFEGQYPWLGYIRAPAEASLGGGLADWFAVTALFRHALGLPIPHTAIVATRKERIGRILGNFVQNHFLSREVVAANLRAVRPAERAAQWLSDPDNARRIAQQVAGGLAKAFEALPDDEVQALVQSVVKPRLRARRVAPALGKPLALVLGDNRQEEVLNVTVRLAAEAVLNNRELIRDRVKAETPWWVPPVLDDKIYQRIIDAVERLLRDMVQDPAHPLRTAFDDAIRDFIERLQHSPDVIARAEAMKEEWLADSSVVDLSARLWETIRHAVITYATSGDAAAPGPLDRGLSEFGTAVLANPTLLAEVDDLLIDLPGGVVEKYRHEIGDLIAQTVAGLEPEATSRRLRLAVGRDLQFVRINGTLVGGLVGLAIYTVSRFWP